jgi:signal transduction histidine kinase
MRSDFVSNVSHEIKTPLTSIKGFVETLLESVEGLPAEAKTYLEIIQKQSDRLDEIVNDLLMLSRLEMGIGKGRMEITDTTAPAKIIVKLDFEKPIKANNTAEFTLNSKGDSTEVTWAMHGHNTFMGKVMSIFMNMDKLVGKDFATGLANLKQITEAK